MSTSVALAALVGGCFPHSPTKRRIAYGVEAATAIAGVVVLATVDSGADCRPLDDDCRSKADLGSLVGVGLLLAGVAGLVTTVISSESSRPAPKPALVPAAPAPPPPPAPPAPAPEPSDGGDPPAGDTPPATDMPPGSELPPASDTPSPGQAPS